MERRRADLQGIDMGAWPTVDSSALPASARDVFAKRSRAIELYAEGMAAREIERQTGVKTRQLYHLLNRCLAQDEDGTLLGFRALIKYRRITPYTRTAAARASDPETGHGLVGAFVLLLASYKVIITRTPPHHFPSALPRCQGQLLDLITSRACEVILPIRGFAR